MKEEHKGSVVVRSERRSTASDHIRQSVEAKSMNNHHLVFYL